MRYVGVRISHREGKMDGCVFGWHLFKGLYHAGIMVAWNPHQPSQSIICHFGLYGGAGFPWNLLDRQALEQGPEGRLETIEAAWRRWMVRPQGKHLYFNERLKVDPTTLSQLRAMIPMIPQDTQSLELTVDRRYSIFRNNCQWFARGLLPDTIRPYVMLQSDRPYVQANKRCLTGGDALPLRMQPGQVLITDWTTSLRM